MEGSSLWGLIDGLNKKFTVVVGLVGVSSA